MVILYPKIITVHEIGYAVLGHITDDGMDYIACGRHFMRWTNPARRNVLITSIKTIENFELPVYDFQRQHCVKWLFFGHDKWKYRKIDTARGCMITFLDGSSMYVKEMESAVKSMIEEK